MNTEENLDTNSEYECINSGAKEELQIFLKKDLIEAFKDPEKFKELFKIKEDKE